MPSWLDVGSSVRTFCASGAMFSVADSHVPSAVFLRSHFRTYSRRLLPESELIGACSFAGTVIESPGSTSWASAV